MHLTIRKTKVIIMKIVKKKVNVNMGIEGVNVKNAEEALFVNMVGDELDAKIVEEALFVNMVFFFFISAKRVGYELLAKIVE